MGGGGIVEILGWFALGWGISLEDICLNWRRLE